MTIVQKTFYIPYDDTPEKKLKQLVADMKGTATKKLGVMKTATLENYEAFVDEDFAGMIKCVANIRVDALQPVAETVYSGKVTIITKSGISLDVSDKFYITLSGGALERDGYTLNKKTIKVGDVLTVKACAVWFIRNKYCATGELV